MLLLLTLGAGDSNELTGSEIKLPSAQKAMLLRHIHHLNLDKHAIVHAASSSRRSRTKYLVVKHDPGLYHSCHLRLIPHKTIIEESQVEASETG